MNEEMNNNYNNTPNYNYEKKNSGVKVLLIILIILVLCLIGLTCYKMFNYDYKNDNKKDNNVVENNNSNGNDNIVETNDDNKTVENSNQDTPIINDNNEDEIINDSEIKEIANLLFEKYTKFKTANGNYIILNTINTEYKYAIALLNVDSKYITSIKIDDNKCSSPAMDDYGNECLIMSLGKGEFEKSYNELFGDIVTNQKYAFSGFSNEHGFYDCISDETQIKCYKRIGGVECGEYDILKLDNYITKGTALKLNVSNLRISCDGYIIDENYDKKVNDSYFNKIKNNNVSEKDKNEIFDKYADKSQKYSLNFKKDSNDDNYYLLDVHQIN